MKLRYGLAITLILLFACSDLWAEEVTDCDDPFIEPVVDMEKMELPNVP